MARVCSSGQKHARRRQSFPPARVTDAFKIIVKPLMLHLYVIMQNKILRCFCYEMFSLKSVAHLFSYLYEYFDIAGETRDIPHKVSMYNDLYVIDLLIM